MAEPNEKKLKKVIYIEGSKGNKSNENLRMYRYIIFLCCLFLPFTSYAHGSHGSGFMAGFTHPILGLDHNLAILGSGVLGYLLDRQKWYIYPLAFIALMVIGGFLGIGQEATTLIEKIIAISVLLIGSLIGLRLNFGQISILLLLAIVGFFHGFAHGAEMPEETTAFKYISGFTIGAASLASIGFGLSWFLDQQNNAATYLTFLGGLLAGGGLIFLLA